MTKISIVQYGERIMLDVAFKCSHRETELDEVSSTQFSPEADSPVETSSTIEVCKNPLCEAWRYPESIEWEDDYMVEVER